MYMEAYHLDVSSDVTQKNGPPITLFVGVSPTW